MANLKTKKTAAGAQQYSAPGKARQLSKNIDKDIEAYVDDKMTKAEFEKKYGISVLKAQNIVYAAQAAEGSNEASSQAAKDINNQYEKELKKRKIQREKELKKRKTNDMSKGGMAKKKMGYATGGLACGASNQAARPLKKGK